MSIFIVLNSFGQTLCRELGWALWRTGGGVPALGELPGVKGSWELHRITGWAAAGTPQVDKILMMSSALTQKASIFWRTSLLDY